MNEVRYLPILILSFLGIFLIGCNPKVIKETGIPERPARVYELSPEKAYALSILASSNLGWKVAFTDAKKKIVVAYTPRSFTTYSVRVKITASIFSKTQTKIDLKCILKGQIMDWGRLDCLMNEFYAELDRLVREEG